MYKEAFGNLVIVECVAMVTTEQHGRGGHTRKQHRVRSLGKSLNKAVQQTSPHPSPKGSLTGVWNWVIYICI